MPELFSASDCGSDKKFYILAKHKPLSFYELREYE